MIAHTHIQQTMQWHRWWLWLIDYDDVCYGDILSSDDDSTHVCDEDLNDDHLMIVSFVMDISTGNSKITFWWYVFMAMRQWCICCHLWWLVGRLVFQGNAGKGNTSFLCNAVHLPEGIQQSRYWLNSWCLQTRCLMPWTWQNECYWGAHVIFVLGGMATLLRKKTMFVDQCPTIWRCLNTLCIFYSLPKVKNEVSLSGCFSTQLGNGIWWPKQYPSKSIWPEKHSSIIQAH